MQDIKTIEAEFKKMLLDMANNDQDQYGYSLFKPTIYSLLGGYAPQMNIIDSFYLIDHLRTEYLERNH